MYIENNESELSPMPQAFADLETIKEAAARLGKHPRTLMRWTRKPDGLPFVRIGQVPYLHGPTVNRWIARRLELANRAKRRRP